ncbi:MULTISPECIES: hypothetical protein [Rhizobium/Agrobacterium group]|uniref:hypothetical protein n=1 Tax=Rhizobium/Agrobacterium group TaxID=227290 RepID=UPI0010D73E2F|nr:MULTISPECIES: hypothetical protein [Rhizobium/Agrobacterium group]TCR64339.1 hypothetical protein EV561_1663 [Rhizobium sp. BK376]
MIDQSKIKEHADVIAFTDVSLVAEWRMAHFACRCAKVAVTIEAEEGGGTV